MGLWDPLVGEHPGGAGRRTAAPDPDLMALTLKCQELLDPAPVEQGPVVLVEVQVPGEAVQQSPLAP